MNELGKNSDPFLFIIDFELNNNLLFRISEIEKENILYQIDKRSNTDTVVKPKTPSKVNIKKYPISYEEYLIGFEAVMDHIKKGNSYLVNYTQPTRININLTLQELFFRSKAKYKLWIKDRFLLFSPETFVQIKKQKIFTYPMKGTIDASIQNAKEKILNSKKEQKEHYTIVDLMRNDLNMIASEVEVTKFRYLEKIHTTEKDLYQVSSEISGTLDNDYKGRIGEIIFSLLPAGSVTGAPKPKTIEIIRTAEKYQRGYYTGIFGYFDGSELASAVNIRFIEQKSDAWFYKSGGGITADSDPKSEYEEMINKVYVPID